MRCFWLGTAYLGGRVEAFYAIGGQAERFPLEGEGLAYDCAHSACMCRLGPSRAKAFQPSTLSVFPIHVTMRKCEQILHSVSIVKFYRTRATHIAHVPSQVILADQSSLLL